MGERRPIPFCYLSTCFLPDCEFQEALPETWLHPCLLQTFAQQGLGARDTSVLASPPSLHGIWRMVLTIQLFLGGNSQYILGEGRFRKIRAASITPNFKPLRYALAPQSLSMTTGEQTYPPPPPTISSHQYKNSHDCRVEDLCMCGSRLRDPG